MDLGIQSRASRDRNCELFSTVINSGIVSNPAISDTYETINIYIVAKAHNKSK